MVSTLVAYFFLEVYMVPVHVKYIIDLIQKKGYEANVVGGAVRDFYLDLPVNDWDITTNATPDVIESIFERTYSVGKAFGTVVVVLDGNFYEVTTYRTEADYSDGRRPSHIAFSKSLRDDLSRRDFTMNAMVMDKYGNITDYYGGLESLKSKMIHTVGNPLERFKEDYLRVYRYVRFNTQLGFNRNEELDKIILNMPINKRISAERIRIEFNKILLSKKPSQGLRHLRELNLLSHILPGIEKTYDFDQHSSFHHLDVFGHILEVVDHTTCKLDVRLAALFHDIGKPDTFELVNNEGHFYKHHQRSHEMAEVIMRRLKYSNATIKTVLNLIHYHMTMIDETNLKSVKKFISRIGKEHLEDFIDLRKADIQGSITNDDLDSIEVMREAFNFVLNQSHPMTLHDLAISGYDLMELGFKGPIIGEIKHELLDHVLHHHNDNKKEILLKIVKEKYHLNN